MLGGLFGRARKTFASRHEAFAAFVLAQFLPQYRWEIPEADFSEWTHDAGSEFQRKSNVVFDLLRLAIPPRQHSSLRLRFPKGRDGRIANAACQAQRGRDWPA